MTKVFYFTGIHGSGKTTVIRKLSEKVNGSYYIFDEMQNFPKGKKIPSHDFQIWYENYLRKRQQHINLVAEHMIYDFIFVDRTYYDVLCYTIADRYLSYDRNDWRDNMESFFAFLKHDLRSIIQNTYENIFPRHIETSIFFLSPSKEKHNEKIFERMEKEKFRINLNENDNIRTNLVQEMFDEYYNTLSSLFNGTEKYFNSLHYIVNDYDEKFFYDVFDTFNISCFH